MTHVNKLVLVPLDEWEKIKSPHNKEGKQVVTVSLPVQKKVSHLSYPQKKIQDHPNSAPVVIQVQKGLGMKKMIMKQLSKYLPPSRRERGASLVRYITKNNIVSWNKDWSLIYKDKTIPHSDIRKLIRHAVLDSDKEPTGMKVFYKGLSQLDVPKIIIANKTGRHLMKKYKTEKVSEFRPPGKLDTLSKKKKIKH